MNCLQFFLYYICGFTKEFTVLCSLFGRACFRTWVWVCLSNLVRICSILAVLSPYDWLRNGGSCHVGFWQKWILTTNLTLGPHFYQIRCKDMQRWPTYRQKCNFQYGGLRHLGFSGISILQVKPDMWLIFDHYVKVGVNLFKNDRVIAV